VDRDALHAFIQRQRYGVVSSVAANGTPQSALVGIAATPCLEIVFDTLKNTRKYANLAQRPACSMAIGWTGEQTLQLDGVAEELHGEARNKLLDVYFRQWPECREHRHWPGIAYFVVRPRWIRFSDYEQRPPLIEEFGPEARAL
jgi:pyridoxine/pyridoxamine 5'-phosphate oxidase